MNKEYIADGFISQDSIFDYLLTDVFPEDINKNKFYKIYIAAYLACHNTDATAKSLAKDLCSKTRRAILDVHYFYERIKDAIELDEQIEPERLRKTYFKDIENFIETYNTVYNIGWWYSNHIHELKDIKDLLYKGTEESAEQIQTMLVIIKQKYMYTVSIRNDIYEIIHLNEKLRDSVISQRGKIIGIDYYG